MASLAFVGVSNELEVPVPDVPFGYLADDVLLAFVYVIYESGFAVSTPIVSPPGWTEVAQQALAFANDQGDRFAVFQRLSTGVEPATHQFTWGGDAIAVGRICGYRRLTAAPLNSSGIVLSVAGDPLIVTMSLPTMRPNQRLVGAWAGRSFDGEWTFPLLAGARRRTQSIDGTLFGTFTDLIGIPGSDEISGRLEVAEFLQPLPALVVETASIGADGGMIPADQIGMGILLVLNHSP